MRYGKYVMFCEGILQKMESFFARMDISLLLQGTLFRLGVNIFPPASLAKMNLFVFSIYANLGAGV